MSASKDLIPELLKRFAHFDALTDGALLDMSKQVDVHSAHSGEMVFRQGSTDTMDFFLVSGELKLTAEDGRSHVIVAGSGLARYPIARLRPRCYTAVANTRIEYLIVDSRSIGAMASAPKTPAHNVSGFEVAEISFETYQMAETQHRNRLAGQSS